MPCAGLGRMFTGSAVRVREQCRGRVQGGATLQVRGVAMGGQRSTARIAFLGVGGPVEVVPSVQCDGRSLSDQQVKRCAYFLLGAGHPCWAGDLTRWGAQPSCLQETGPAGWGLQGLLGLVYSGSGWGGAGQGRAGQTRAAGGAGRDAPVPALPPSCLASILMSEKWDQTHLLAASPCRVLLELCRTCCRCGWGPVTPAEGQFILRKMG